MWKTFNNVENYVENSHFFVLIVENYVENLSCCGKVCGKLEKLWKTSYKIISKKHLTSPLPYDILQLQSNETLTLNLK